MADADVVGLQEAEGHTRRIADALGWEYADERMQVISRYPLIDPPGADGLYTFIAPRPGQVIAIANVHLTSNPYGPDAVLAGSTPEDIQAIEEETRLPGLEAHLARLPALVTAGIPVFLTGDFNSPSHLDGQVLHHARRMTRSTPRWRGRWVRHWPRRGSSIPSGRPIPMRRRGRG